MFTKTKFTITLFKSQVKTEILNHFNLNNRNCNVCDSFDRGIVRNMFAGIYCILNNKSTDTLFLFI